MWEVRIVEAAPNHPTVSCEAPAYLDLPRLSHHWLALTVPQGIPFGFSPPSPSGPPGKLGPSPPPPHLLRRCALTQHLLQESCLGIPEVSAHCSSLWAPQCMGTAGGWGRAAAGSPPGTGVSPEAPRGVRSFPHQLWLPFSLLLCECSQLLLPLRSGLIALSCWARCSHASLDLLQEWKSRREKGGSAAERLIPAPSPRLLPHEAPTKGSAQPSSLRQRAGVCSGRACWGWGRRESAVGPLASFQSLPFINIYSSSATKNNILEPREEGEK